MTITRTKITTRRMKHDKKDDEDCDGDDDEDEDEDKRRTTTTTTTMTMATMATIVALTASGEQKDSYDVRNHGDRQ